VVVYIFKGFALLWSSVHTCCSCFLSWHCLNHHFLLPPWSRFFTAKIAHCKHFMVLWSHCSSVSDHQLVLFGAPWSKQTLKMSWRQSQTSHTCKLNKKMHFAKIEGIICCNWREMQCNDAWWTHWTMTKGFVFLCAFCLGLSNKMNFFEGTPTSTSKTEKEKEQPENEKNVKECFCFDNLFVWFNHAHASGSTPMLIPLRRRTRLCCLCFQHFSTALWQGFLASLPDLASLPTSRWLWCLCAADFTTKP